MAGPTACVHACVRARARACACACVRVRTRTRLRGVGRLRLSQQLAQRRAVQPLALELSGRLAQALVGT
eukprot:5744609-Pleurochrysis_carterae.AAC.1